MSSDHPNNIPELIPEDQGNIWGSKFTKFSWVLLLSLIAFMAYRHWKLGVPIQYSEPQVQQDTVR